MRLYTIQGSVQYIRTPYKDLYSTYVHLIRTCTVHKPYKDLYNAYTSKDLYSTYIAQRYVQCVQKQDLLSVLYDTILPPVQYNAM